MVTIRSVEGSLIEAETYTELLKAVKNELENYDGYEPEVNFLTRKTAIIYHAEIVDELAERPSWYGRYCCECDIYRWGRGCDFREGHVTLKMPACEHFTRY